jgi:nitrate reductase NapD
MPEHLVSVSQTLTDMQGVEIHAQSEQGKLVVSIDHPSRSYCGNAMTDMSRINGVMRASLVYEYQEDLDDHNIANSSLSPTLDGDTQ